MIQENLLLSTGQMEKWGSRTKGTPYTSSLLIQDIPSKQFNIVDINIHFNIHIKEGGPGGSMSWVVGSNSSYKPITNMAWVHTQLCK